MTKLFEKLLLEASKQRFISKIWDELEDDPNSAMAMTRYKTAMLPTSDAMTMWVDSGAADKYLKQYNFNW